MLLFPANYRSAVLIVFLTLPLAASEATDRAHRLEDAGDSVAARSVFSQAVQATPNDPELRTAWAEFLERYHDPSSRAEYRRAAASWTSAGKAVNAAAAARRAVLLDLLAGDRKAAESDLAVFQAAGGKDLSLPVAPASADTARQYVYIPGPLRSFARMAAISGDSDPEGVLPALARNIVTNGFQASRSNEALEETEYLKLVHRYISQARELEKLAGPDKILKVPACESTQTNDLLRILGFRMRGGCGSEVVLETVNAPRAFLSTDSGFPIAQLEQSLRTDKPFSYDYQPTRVPVLYTPDYWITSKEKTQGDFLDAFLADPALCRFYLGMSKLDPDTADALKLGMTPVRLRALANVLDFFGGNFEIRQGRAVVPGGARSAPGWSELAGAPPDRGAEFFEKLMVKDDGWLASLFDALARIQGPVREYLTDPARMKRFYAAVRGKITTPGPARPVFRSNADMMLLTTRLQLDRDGKPHIPGGLEVWKNLFARNPRGKYDAKLSRASATWKEPDDVLEALFALSRKPVDNEPLRIFMALSDIDRSRPEPMQPATVEALVKVWTVYGSQYAMFGDAPVSDKTILAWLGAAGSVDKIRDTQLRQDSIGTFQGLAGLWQIFCRQGSISPARADDVLAGIAAQFADIRNNRALFDAGRQGLDLLVKNTGAASGTMQERLLGLLAGGTKLDDSESRATLVQEEQRIFEAQKLLPADLVFELADNLEGVSKGEKLNAQLASRMASRVADIQLPRNSMTGAEKNSMAFGYYVDKHIDDERRLNFRAMIDRAAKDPEKLKDIRGLLAPTLRDTIIGYNYIHYAPPGAQILMTNPMFVRGHDFIGMQGANRSWRTTEMYGTGWPSNAGGRLVGSLSGLPYALAEAEQNFLVPTQTQALIWGDLVPQMILTAKAPRFWNVKPTQMHWVALNMRFAESELAEAVVNPAEREPVFSALETVSSPWRAALVRKAVTDGDARLAAETLTPSELWSIARILAVRKPGADNPVAREVAHYRSISAEDVSAGETSRAWGTPKPTLANSYRSELLNLRTFPTLMGYSSRIMAESWESNLLYWADVADEAGIRPDQLNVLVPDWTRKVVERIFASHLEDWPALLKSLRSVGGEIRAQSAQGAAKAGTE